jgi:hypothetical protein
MSTSREKIEHLHGLYCRLSGQQIRLDMARESTWFEWCRRGFTGEDLAAMIRYLRAQVNEGKRNMGCIKFSNLIGNPDFFEEDLAQLRALRRPQPPATRTIRSGQTERIVPADRSRDAAVPVADVIEAMRKAAQ